MDSLFGFFITVWPFLVIGAFGFAIWKIISLIRKNNKSK